MNTIETTVPVAITLEATLLKAHRYAVRPQGSLGTCGSYPILWTVEYVNARNEKEAIKKAILRMKVKTNYYFK